MIKGDIESIAFGGEGILRYESLVPDHERLCRALVIFVPFTAPGDSVEVEILSKKKNFAHGKLLRLAHPSPQRTDPKCFYFGSCGGCQLQHLNYPAQLEAKRAFIIDALKRIGKVEVPNLSITPAKEQWAYRRHIRFNLRNEGEGFKAGYIGCDPAQFVPVAKCPIFIPSEETLLGTLESFLQALSNEGIEEGSLRLIKANNDKFILAFTFSPALPCNFRIAEKELASQPKWQGIVMQSPKEKIVFGDVHCEIETLGLKARFSPFGFVQNHPEQSENLYRAILEALPENSEKILDLYCGIGMTSLLCAKRGKKVALETMVGPRQEMQDFESESLSGGIDHSQKAKAIPPGRDFGSKDCVCWPDPIGVSRVIGVETHAETIALAKENAARNKISTVEFHQGKAESLGVKFIKEEHFDAVLCNPPRTGIDPVLLQTLATEKPACILYVSCMPSTLARDLQKLTQSGYKIESIQGFDMFPQTTHVEALVKLVL